MGLADFKARLLLFFARKLREWANSIDENASPPPQPTSVVDEEHVSDDAVVGTGYGAPPPGPANQQAPRAVSGPPQYWVELVRAKAPELLSLMEYSVAEDSVAEDQLPSDAAEVSSHTDSEVERSVPQPNKPPAIAEELTKKSQPAPLPVRKANRQPTGRNLAKGKSVARPRHLTLKPLSETGATPKPTEYTLAQEAEREEPPQPIELPSQNPRAESREPLPEAPRPVWVATEETPTREAPIQVSPQESSSHESPEIHVAHRVRSTSVFARATPGEPDVKKAVDSKQPVLEVINQKTESGNSRASRPAGFSPNSSTQDFSRMTGVVLSAESSKSQTPVEHLTPSSPVIQGKKEKRITLAGPRVRAQQTATRRASLPSRSSEVIKDGRSAFGPPSPVTFPRSVNRSREAANTLIQEPAVNMPALMDEETMNKAASFYFAKLSPGENPWPDLPSATSTEVADELEAQERETDRLQRLEREQRGTPWNV